MRTEQDLIFRSIAQVQDPFLSNPYLLALLDLPPKQRRTIVRQVVLLCAATDLDPLGALEVIAAVSPFVEVTRPKTG